MLKYFFKNVNIKMMKLLRRFSYYSAILVLLLIAPIAKVNAAFPGNNGKIIFSSDKDSVSGTGGDLYSMNTNGTGVTRLTSDEPIEDSVEVSPLGDKITYIKSDSIWVNSIDGSNPALLSNASDGEYNLSDETYNVVNGSYRGTTWSPDGLFVASAYSYTRTNGLDSDDLCGIAIINVATGEWTDFIYIGYSYLGLAGLKWSPTGDELAFSREPNDSSSEQIFTLNIDTGDQTQLTNTTNYDNTTPDWGPDGQYLTFNSNRNTSGGEIYKMNDDGTNQTRLTNNSQIDMLPFWSPDGTKIVYTTWVQTNPAEYAIYVMNTDGTGQTKLIGYPGNDIYSSTQAWQPAGVTPYVYRFWSPSKHHHFYANFDETAYVLQHYPDSEWTLEGVAYRANGAADCGSESPVYRFWSDTYQGHFYTISSAEKDYVISHYPTSVWRYEGQAFCANTSQVSGTVPLYRFWSDEYKGHFYTTSEGEKQYVIDAYPDNVWRYEGVAYFVK